MCLIVDANVATKVLAAEPSPDFAPVHEALLAGRAKIVYGGLLTNEYARLGAVRRFVAQLDRAGRARQLPRGAVDTETARLAAAGQCRSNDHHVIAIARLGGVRLLCSRDQALHADFTDKALVDDPRGNVYQNPTHTHLIRRHCAP